jgi:hypothetical protein
MSMYNKKLTLVIVCLFTVFTYIYLFYYLKSVLERIFNLNGEFHWL